MQLILSSISSVYSECVEFYEKSKVKSAKENKHSKLDFEIQLSDCLEILTNQRVFYIN